MGSRLTKAGGPNQGRRSQSHTAQERYLWLSASRKEKEAISDSFHFPKDKLDHPPCPLMSFSTRRGGAHLSSLAEVNSASSPLFGPHQALDSQACRNQTRNSQKTVGPSSSLCTVRLPQPPSLPGAPNTRAQPSLCPGCPTESTPS